MVDEQGAILERLLAPTPSHRPARRSRTRSWPSVNELRSRHRVDAVGIGAAGWVDNEQAVVRFSPHLAWRSEPLKARLTARIDLPLIVDNDANAAAWAEYRFGAGRGSSVMVCLTLGTGIGGGLVIGGQLFRGTYGMAGEWGHMISVPGGHWCECGNRGCWEQYASGNALVREARELARTNSPTAYRLLELVGGDPDKITGPDVTAAAIRRRAELGRAAGRRRGLARPRHRQPGRRLDPEVVVIGGGVSAAGDLLLLPAQRAFSRTLTGRGFREEARIVLAHFRNDAGLIGAADLARHAMVEPPDSAAFGFWPRLRKTQGGEPPRPAARGCGPPAPDLAAPRNRVRASQLQDGAVAGVRGPASGQPGHQDAEAGEEADDGDPARPGREPGAEGGGQHQQHRVRDPDQAEQRRHAGPGHGRQRLGNVRSSGSGSAAGSATGTGSVKAEQRMLVRP